MPDKKRNGEIHIISDPNPSSAELYARRLQYMLDQVLAELDGSKGYDELTSNTRKNLLWVVSGGSGEVVQCAAETIQAISEKLSKVSSSLESADSKSYIYKALIRGNLEAFLADLKKGKCAD